MALRIVSELTETGGQQRGLRHTSVKGSVHVVVQRGFVDHVLHDARVVDLLNWTRRVRIPDETFFSTLNHNPALGIPGAYKGGVYIRGACISGVGFNDKLR